MPAQHPEPRKPVYSPAIEDLTVPGVVVELDPDEAEANGAFRESALTEADAWEANDDGGDDGE